VAVASVAAALCLFALSHGLLRAPARVYHGPVAARTAIIPDEQVRLTNQQHPTPLDAVGWSNMQVPDLQEGVNHTLGQRRVPDHAMPFVVIGVATTPKNTGHRSWIRATWMTLPNVRAGTVHSVFLIGLLTPMATAHSAAMRSQLRSEQAEFGDLLLLNARETKPPGEKMIGFFRWCATSFGSTPPAAGAPGRLHEPTRYCVKTDDDTYVHTVRLELNLRALWTGSSPATVDGREHVEGPYQYAGATLWASYVPTSFEVCGHGMGPNMAAAAARTERCVERGAIGPFPYVAGTLEVLSMPLAEWMIEQKTVNEFVQRAHARTPVAWNIGEDTVLGMWVHQSPFAITAMHWGWDKVHDLCFRCKDKQQLWKPITDQSVVIHIKGHQAYWENFDNVHRNFTQRCDEACQKWTLPFDVPSLANLCRRNDQIRRGYSKCSLVT